MIMKDFTMCWFCQFAKLIIALPLLILIIVYWIILSAIVLLFIPFVCYLGFGPWGGTIAGAIVLIVVLKKWDERSI